MDKRIPFVSFVCLPSLWLFACGSQSDLGAERTSDTTLTQQQLLSKQIDNATLTLQEAIDIAVAAHPDGQLVEADLDGKSTQPRFEIELLVDGKVIEVHVDAQTGEILQRIDEDSDGDDDGDSKHTCDAGISLEEAVALAEAHVGGNAVEVENDDCAFEIVVKSEAGLVEVDVANDGTVGRVETDDDDRDDDDRDDDDLDDDDRDDDDRDDDDRDDDDRDDDDRDDDDLDDDDLDDDDRDDDDRDDDDRDAAVDCTTSITVEQATAIALEAAAGTVLRVEHDNDDDCDFEISVQTATGVVEIDIAADGTVRQIEQDD